MTIITTIELEVEVDGEYRPGTRAHFDREHGNWLPGDPPEIKNLKVSVVRGNRSVDITNVIPNSLEDQIINELIDEHLRNGDKAV